MEHVGPLEETASARLPDSASSTTPTGAPPVSPPSHATPKSTRTTGRGARTIPLGVASRVPTARRRYRVEARAPTSSIATPEQQLLRTAEGNGPPLARLGQQPGSLAQVL